MRKRGIRVRDDFFSGLRFALGNELPEPQLNKICIEISRHYGGECVYISKTYSRQLSVRNDTIKQEVQSGLRPSQLAERYGMSARQIQRIIKT